MAWVAVAGAAVGVIGNSLLNHSSGNNSSSNPGTPAAAADPFASQRPQYQQQLSAMMQPGATFNPQDPSYKFRLDQGMETLNRGAAASGMLDSGNRMAALMAYGQNTASSEYSNQFQRLSQLAGANVGSPAAAGQIQAGQNAASSAFMQGIGTQVAGGISNWWNGSSGGGNNTPAAVQGSTVGAGDIGA